MSDQYEERFTTPAMREAFIAGRCPKFTRGFGSPVGKVTRIDVTKKGIAFEAEVTPEYFQLIQSAKERPAWTGEAEAEE